MSLRRRRLMRVTHSCRDRQFIPTASAAGNARTVPASTSLAMHGPADRSHQDEGELAALHLLVLRHQRHQRVGVREPFLREAGDVLQPGRQADLGEMLLRRGPPRSSAIMPSLRRKLRTPAPCRAATPSPWNSRSEKPVAASSAWPKVWPRLSSARSPVSRSSRDDDRRPWRGRRSRSRARARRRPRRRRAWLASEPGEEGRRRRAGRTWRPRHSRRGTARGDSVSSTRGIGDDQDRLMEGAEQVLALRRVDAGLAADRGIDLRQQRGRHLHEIDAAAHDRRRKAGEIADHAAAQRDHEIVALDLRGDQRLADLFEAGIALGPLAFARRRCATIGMPAIRERPLRRARASAWRRCGR